VREIKTCVNIWIQTYKPTKTGIEISKHPPRHIGPESERDKNKYNYIDSIIQTDKDRKWNKPAPTQTHASIDNHLCNEKSRTITT
jgi:hypothetical protein